MRNRKAPLWRALASVLTGALVASAALVGVAAPASAADGYSLSASSSVVANTKATVNVSGSGYGAIPLLPGQQARTFYIALIAKGTPLSDIGQGGQVANTAVFPVQDGTFTGTLEQTAANLDRTKSYEVIAWPSRSNPSDANLFARTDVTIDWAALFPPTSTTTTLTVSPSGSSEAGASVTLTATVAPASSGSVTFASSGSELGSSAVNAGTASYTVTNPVSGPYSFTATFTPEQGTNVTGSTSSAVAHTVNAPVVVVPPETRTPKLTLSKSSGLAAAGETITVTGSGYNPAQPIYLTTCTDVPLSDVSFTFISTGCTVGAKQVTSNPTSPTQVKFNADGSFETTLLVAPKVGSTAVYTIANHTAMADRTQDAKATVTFAKAPPKLTLSKSTGLAAAGETITVTGSGYNPNQPIYLTTCTDVPLSDVSFSFISTGCVAGAKQITLNPTTATQVKFNADGSFETTLLVAPKVGSTAVYTIANHTAMADRTQDAKATVTFAKAPIPTPTLTVTPDTALDPSGATLVITGQNFTDTSRDDAGFFVAVGSVRDGWKPSEGGASADRKSVASKRVQSAAGNDDNSLLQWTRTEAGTYDFTWTVTVTRAEADTNQPSNGTGTFGVYTFGSAAVTGLQADKELFVPLTWAQAPVEPTDAPKITVSPSVDLDASVENVLTISGTNFVGAGAASGAYVLFGETSVWSGGSALPSAGWISQAWVRSSEIVDGAFTTTLTIPAGTLDASKSYQVATSAAHGLSITDRSLDTFAPVTVSDEAPSEPLIFLSADSVQQGGSLEVRGTGFPAGELVTVTVNSDPITLGSGLVNGSGSFVVSGTIPLSFATGSHTVVATAGEARAESALTVAAATVLPADETPAVATCVAQAVSGATIQWSVKESFRAYVEGPIAKGSYSIGWGSGSGAYSTETDRGRVGFGGSANFTGHSGLLDLTISNPRIQVNSATSASLIVNVTSKGFNGTPDVSQSGVVFATLSLPAASETSSRISWSGASATLTASGAAAFAGFYEAGAALDPVSFSFPLGAEVPCDSSTTGDLAATGGEAPLDAMWLGFGMLVLGAGIFVMRRRAARV